ncbi:polysaccharide deacetylase family protein [Methylobacterium sp. CM6257]
MSKFRVGSTQFSTLLDAPCGHGLGLALDSMWEAPLGERLYRSALGLIGKCAHFAKQEGQLIVSLHSISPGRRSDLHVSALSISAEFLEDLIRDCARKSIPILGLAEALQRWHARDRRPFLVLTFDDGYRDLYTNGFSILERHGVPFTVFVTTGIVDRSAPMWWHALELALARTDRFHVAAGPLAAGSPRQKLKVFRDIAARFRAADSDLQRRMLEDLANRNESLRLEDAYESGLDWAMVQAMQNSGLAEIGCHSVSHPEFAGLDRHAIRSEITRSRDRIAEVVGVPPRFFAYPYGQPHEVGACAPAIVKACGFQAGLSTNPAALSWHPPGDDYLIPRVVLSKKGEDLMVVQSYRSGWPQKIRTLLAT